MKLEIFGGHRGAPMSYESFLRRARSILTGLPAHPPGHWHRVGDAEDAVTHSLNQIPVDPHHPDSLAAAVETASRRGNAWKMVVFRGSALRVDAYAYDGARNRMIVDVDLPDSDAVEIRETIHQYMATLVEAWQPRWLRAGPAHLNTQQGVKGLPDEILVGWNTYLAPDVSLDATSLADAVTRPARRRRTVHNSRWNSC